MSNTKKNGSPKIFRITLERLGVLSPFQVHGQPASEVLERPWGERSFYVTDTWGNELCFVQEGTLYT